MRQGITLMLKPYSHRFFGSVVYVCLIFTTNPGWAQEVDVAAEKTFLGTEMCSTCHKDISNHWAHTLHAKIFLQNPRDDFEKQGCEACHGPGSGHLTNPTDPTGIIRFTSGSGNSIRELNGACLQCHQGGERLHWVSSVHESSDLACSDCHNPMAEFSANSLLVNNNVNETCFSCHKEQRSQFNRRSHMPLSEGKMQCTDCHNPHGSTTDGLLKTNTVNETCYTCHAEKRGPFIFEHAPVRDSCTNCHTPHGSNHEKLLLTARPMLCQQCHTSVGHMNELFTRGSLATGSVPDARLMGRSCQNCHTQIHGSNHPSGAKFQR